MSAVDPNILTTLRGSVAQGQFLNPANIKYPVAVLGANAAQALGTTSLNSSPAVSIGGQIFTVVGILKTCPLSSNLDNAALIGIPAAVSIFGVADTPSTIDVRANPNNIDAVLAGPAATANPENPDQVSTTRPTAQLEAAAVATSTLTELPFGLGAVALLGGGVGIASIMVITVLERRSEIGLRRAPGATRCHMAGLYSRDASCSALADFQDGRVRRPQQVELRRWPQGSNPWARTLGRPPFRPNTP